MEATGTRQCPKCRIGISKHSLHEQHTQRRECHKMLCRNCGTRFCFKCLAVLTDAFTCGCSKNKHGFIDPYSGEVIGHLKRGKSKKVAASPDKPKRGATKKKASPPDNPKRGTSRNAVVSR